MYKRQIDQSAQIWNSSVSSIKLTDAGQGAQANVTYTEGNDPRGSWAMTYSFGNGEIFLDYAQANEYDALRIVTHETGRILGLPDNYAGPCSELMSGGGPAPRAPTRTRTPRRSPRSRRTPPTTAPGRRTPSRVDGSPRQRSQGGQRRVAQLAAVVAPHRHLCLLYTSPSPRD